MTFVALTGDMPQVTSKMGLAAWNQQLDLYDYTQFANNWNIVDFHDHSPGRGVQIGAAGISPGAVMPQHLTLSLLQDLGLNGGGNSGRGFFAKTGADSTSNTAFTSLGDVVTGIQVQTNGLIMMDYHALWKSSSVSFAASADVFIGANELVNGTSGAVAPVSTTATTLQALLTTGVTLSTGSAQTWASDVTTGASMGGSMMIYVAPGTYTVGIQFKVASGGTVTVQNRHLWARTVNFV